MTAPKKPVLATRLASGFRCVGPTCEDSCCAGWLIEVDNVTLKKYQRKHDLLHATQPYDKDAHAMCCDPPHGTCQQYHNGLCTIQQRYGEDFLSDTCYFFPRVFRRLGSQSMMGASLSCPEAARMALYEKTVFSRTPCHLERDITLPEDYLPDGLTENYALEFHQHILTSLEDTSLSAEQHIIRLIELCYALTDAEYVDWAALTASHLHAAPQPLPEYAPDNVLRILRNLLAIAVADGSQYRPRLYQTIRDMEKALETPLHWKEATIDHKRGNLQAVEAVRESWRIHGKEFDIILRNWVAAYVSNKVFPFGGLGENPREEIFLLCIYFATVKWALMCACHRENQLIAPNEIIRIIQSISRLYDHITEAEVFRDAYNHPDWQEKKGLSALIA